MQRSAHGFQQVLRALPIVSLAAIGLVAVAFLAGGSAAQEQEEIPEPGLPPEIPAEAVNMKNPVSPTKESVEYGQLIYSSQCTMCHGEAGAGDGRLVERLGYEMPDFTNPEGLGNRTDGEIFHILTYGHGKMRGKGDRYLDKTKWDIVNFLRTLDD